MIRRIPETFLFYNPVFPKGVDMNVLMSVRPEFAEKILDGSKKYEFRKTVFRKHVDRVYIYSSSPVKRIVGFFSMGGVLEGTPEELWEKCRHHSNTSRESFFGYLRGSDKAYAIKIKNPKKFSEPVDPRSLVEGFVPPQSFCYVSEEFGKRIERGKIR